MSTLCILWLLTLLALSGCKKEIVPEAYHPSNAHEAYMLSLTHANLIETALGKDWISASESAMHDAVDIIPPFEEAFYVSPAEAFALAYRFDVKRGQRVEIDVAYNGQQPARLFIDLFRVSGMSAEEWVHVASADEDENRLEFEPRRDAEYVIRLQPELLRGGQFTVRIRNVKALEFPVTGFDSRAIGSGFGAPRDGGRRRHHGVDIFVPRHTPVIAPSEAYAEYVGEGGIGGRWIWLYDTKRSLYMYFAHLQTQDVEPHSKVAAGQVIGTVGNSGNARTTPPHLHFGIYMRGQGPVDPHHFITRTKEIPSPISADTLTLGQYVRSNRDSLTLHSNSGDLTDKNIPLDRHTPMKILAAADNSYRVLLPDGISGYVPAGSVETIEESLERQSVLSSQAVREAPSEDAVEVETLNVGEPFSVLGMYEGYWFVRTKQDRMGWLQIIQASPAVGLSSNSDKE